MKQSFVFWKNQTQQPFWYGSSKFATFIYYFRYFLRTFCYCYLFFFLVFKTGTTIFGQHFKTIFKFFFFKEWCINWKALNKILILFASYFKNLDKNIGPNSHGIFRFISHILLISDLFWVHTIIFLDCLIFNTSNLKKQ